AAHALEVEPAARDEGGRGRGLMVDLEDAQVPLPRQNRQRALAAAGGDDVLEERLADLAGGRLVDFTVEGDGPAEGRDRVAGGRPLVGVVELFAAGNAAGRGVLDDGDGGRREVLDGGPGRVEIEQVVERERLPMELLPAGDTRQRRTPRTDRIIRRLLV